jgi:serine O-acetyltransferase
MSNSPKLAGEAAVQHMQGEIALIVTELRKIRVASLEHRQRLNRPPKLPSRKSLAAVVEGLAAALFPNRLGPPGLTDEGIDYFVGHTLDVALRELCDQVARELRFAGQDSDIETRACHLVREFAADLPAIRLLLDSDIRAAYEGDPAARSSDEVLVCYPGITAVTHQRIAHRLHRLGVPLIARIVSEIAHSLTGIDIHPGAEIGESFFIDHGTGVVIGETTLIGDGVRIYQGVTLGALSVPQGEARPEAGVRRHPTIEDDVVIYANATILGGDTVIGKGSVIGGNAFVTTSVPAGSRVPGSSRTQRA